MKTCFARVREWRERGGVTQYHVQAEFQVTQGKDGKLVKGSAWHRFSDFDALRQSLKADGEDVSKCLLPSKYFSTSAQNRQIELGRLMKNLFSHLVLNNDISNAPRALLEFCDLPVPEQNGPSAGSYVAFEPVCDTYRERMDSVIGGVSALADAAKSGTLESQGWKKVGSSGPFEWHSNAELDSRMVFGVVPQCTDRMVHDILYRPSDFCKLEVNINTVRDVERLGPQTIVQHVVMKSIMWMPCRDVILVRHWRTLQSGRTVLGDFTLDDYSGVPPMDTQGKVRAKETLGGCVLEPQGKTRCFVMIVNDMDPRVPGASSVQGQINDYSAGMLSKNLLNLADLVKRKDLEKYIELGPMMNIGKHATAASLSTVDDADKLSLDESSKPSSTWLLLAAGVALAAFYASAS